MVVLPYWVIMGVFYMKHFIHGTKVACGEFEVEHDKKNGWVQYDPSAPQPAEVEESVNVLTKRPYNRKPKE